MTVEEMRLRIKEALVLLRVGRVPAALQVLRELLEDE
jgi:hypothetical protein